ncbi:hypothetical protein GPECTOR_42g838 [Gonium pectorale]|uniref:Uncharacterized protein n=1 Tax=Gonium pectorale TaxID=33097 RepID=A0A150G9V4_GONPE|nr:hypothetical protein GPECTOR_42g838 [Gonium pectorale]|eukprot:KXZ46627.1 hypothetical protein GPECTOR_42g838 [Gonium pectorale]
MASAGDSGPPVPKPGGLITAGGSRPWRPWFWPAFWPWPWPEPRHRAGPAALEPHATNPTGSGTGSPGDGGSVADRRGPAFGARVSDYNADDGLMDDEEGHNSDVCMYYDVSNSNWYTTLYGVDRCPDLPVGVKPVELSVTLSDGTEPSIGTAQAWEDAAGYMVVSLILDCPWMMMLDPNTAGASFAVTVTQIGVDGSVEGTWSHETTMTTYDGMPYRTCSSFRFDVRGNEGSGADVAPGPACTAYNRIVEFKVRRGVGGINPVTGHCKRRVETASPTRRLRPICIGA